VAQAILGGRLAPAERLIETEVAEKLGVSRTTVREAFLMLERDGLVVSKPHRGTFVTRITRRDAIDLGYARALLEGFAVAAGRERIDAAFVTTMESYLLEMTACRLPDDLPRLVEIDLAFHGTIMRCSPLPLLVDLWESLNGQLGAVYMLAVEEFQMTVDDLVDFHRSLVSDLQSDDLEVGLCAVIDHYVRVDGRSNVHGSAIRKVIEAVTGGQVIPATAFSAALATASRSTNRRS
jgi:DNA-binding GntR family transcriptional regulator